MGKDRRKKHLTEKEAITGAFLSNEDIDNRLSIDNALVAELVPRNPFLPNEQGWYLWIVWAKLKVMGKKYGVEPWRGKQTMVYEENDSKSYGAGPGVKGPVRIYKVPKIPKKSHNRE